MAPPAAGPASRRRRTARTAPSTAPASPTRTARTGTQRCGASPSRDASAERQEERGGDQIDQRLGHPAPVQQEQRAQQRPPRRPAGRTADRGARIRPSASSASRVRPAWHPRRARPSRARAPAGRSRRARRRPASARRAAPARRSASRRSASASASGRSGSTRSAAPAVSSARPPRPELTKAAPLAMASSAVSPNGSGQRLGTTTIAARAIASSTAVVRPVAGQLHPARRGRGAQRGQERRVAATGRSGRRRSSPHASPAAPAAPSAQAATKLSAPLSATSRPANRISRSRAGAGQRWRQRREVQAVRQQRHRQSMPASRCRPGTARRR